MTTDTETLDLIREAIAAWKSGELTEFSCLIAINSVVNPAKITPRDIEIAKKLQATL